MDGNPLLTGNVLGEKVDFRLGDLEGKGVYIGARLGSPLGGDVGAFVIDKNGGNVGYTDGAVGTRSIVGPVLVTTFDGKLFGNREGLNDTRTAAFGAVLTNREGL